MRVVALTRFVAAALLSVAVGGIGAAPAVEAAPRAGLQPGEVVVADQDAGQVLRVSPSDAPEVLLDDLGSVRGVVVLSDGAVLAADSDAGVIVGIGGRFGDERVEVATGLEAPEALALATEDRVYVTSFSEGTLSRVDLATGSVEAVAAGLDGPSAVLPLREPRRANNVAAAEWFGGSVAVLGRDGHRASTLIDGLERPAGLATDGDGTVYVTDRDAGTVIAVNQAGQARTVAEVDQPTGIGLDPAQPAAGQSYDLIVATGDGIQRIDADTGSADIIADIDAGAGLAVAPDEFVAAPVTTGSSVAEGEGGSVGGDVASASGSDIDYTLVGLIALIVFLSGVALVTLVQLIRARGDDDVEEEEVAPMTRKEARRAKSTERAVQAAERKTAKEVEKAEKRAAKLAPPEPDPEPAPIAAPRPPSTPIPLFAGDLAPPVEEPPAAEPVARIPAEAPPTTSGVREAKADARAQAKQAKADAKAAEAATAAQAKDGAKQSKAEAKQAKVQARVDAQQARAQAAADEQRAQQEAKEAKAQAKAAAKAAKKGGPPLPAADDIAAAAPVSTAGPDLVGDDLVAAALAVAAVAPTPAAEPEPEPEPEVDLDLAADEPVIDEPAAEEVGRAPLFASPSAPQTPGPFLESLFTPPSAPAELPAEDEPAPAPLLPVPAPSLPEPVAPAPMASSSLALPASTSEGDVTDLVVREVAPPRGLRGRRRAKRRRKVAEHRHQKLRAISAINAVPLPAAPPLPVRTETERAIAPAVSVASPDVWTPVAALDAPTDEGSGEAMAVPWPDPAVNGAAGADQPWPGRPDAPGVDAG